MHEKDPYPEKSPHLVWALCDIWKDMGIEIVFLKGPTEYVKADLLLPHIDLTELPESYTALFEKYPRVANRGLHSIAKCHISRQLLTGSDTYDGPVIVKTNLNFAGIPEEKIYGAGDRHSAPRKLLGAFFSKKRPGINWENIRRMKQEDYRVFPSLKAVPQDVFRNSNLVVERFLPEYENGLYYIRIHQFVGNRGYCVRLGSTEPIVKQKNIISRDEVETPPEVAAFRKYLGMDYGKLDFVIHQGRPVILDANRTPGLIKPTELMKKRSELLAPGIHHLLRQDSIGEIPA